MMKANDVKDEEDFLDRANGHVHLMSCKDYHDAIRREVDHVLLDVRSEDEFEENHLEEAINIPRGDLEFDVDDIIPNRNMPIMLCCGTGKRSALAAKTLHEMGYSDVRVLEGGIDAYTDYKACLT